MEPVEGSLRPPFGNTWSVRICRPNRSRNTPTTCGCWAGRSSAI